ncbi:MAG TPA: nucleotide sugar dehydrogenase [Polyangiaceae bacterium]|nr:nucleotide sugar dehydrogenase [Polyangiaceae bacterium]
MNERVAVVGLGYVGLPVALALAKRHPGTVGFDIKAKRVAELREGRDSTGEAEPEALKASSIRYTDQLEDLRGSTFFVVTVPTPIDANKQPDLTAVIKATESVGKVLEKGGVVVYESTVYPGVTEDICRPILARVSGLKPGVDFKVGYSPERINPGDREHTLERVIKVVSGEDEESLERVAGVYGAIVPAGVHRAPSIKAAEAAKVIENTQRDLNIALMNELAIIFDKMGIPTRDVLAAAGTKWNFLKFVPGLVGGHCIGVDPYYLTAKAELLNYHPQVILAGRRINDGMGQYIAQRLVKMLIAADRPVKNARVAVLGLTFKENVPDLRNSRVPDILNELTQFGVNTFVHDPIADDEEAHEEYGLHLTKWDALTDLDAVVLAVSHKQYDAQTVLSLVERMKKPGVLVDVKSAFDRSRLPQNLSYWSL